jgi:hypothetical protein
MTPELITAIISLTARYGIPAALSVLNNLRSAVTIEDAIAALKAADVPMEQLIDEAKLKAISGQPSANLGEVQASVFTDNAR